jgi:UDP-glucose 4-epimerase
MSNLDEVLGNIEFTKTDIRRLRPKDLEGVDIVFHGAALPRVPLSVKYPERTNRNNVDGTLHLLEVARRAKVKKFIYASSSSIYGDQDTFPLGEDLTPRPLSPYAVQKLVGEYYGQVYHALFGLPFVALRYFNVFGPGQDESSPYSGIITLLKKWKREGKPFTIYGDGTISRDFTWVGDVVRANLCAATAEVGSGAYNIGGGRETTLNELCRFVGSEGQRIIYKPARASDPLRTCADITRAGRELGWFPEVSVEEGLKMFE